jgi:hypothetical protein
MYVRFIVLAPRRRRPFGLFNGDTELLEDPTLPAWLREPIDDHFRWFRSNLRSPFRRGPKRRRIKASAICWFTPEAQDHIARARELAWLIAEAGHPTAMIKARRVGAIVYRDAYQVAAIPDPRTPLRT